LLIQATIYHFPTNEETNDHLLSTGTIPHRTSSIRSTTRYHAQSHRVTRMLIIVSTCFLLLNAPSHICTISLKLYALRQSRLINNSHPTLVDLLNNSNETNFENSTLFHPTLTSPIYMENGSKSNFKFYTVFYIIVVISQHIAYLSYSINFFLYSFCGMKFRGELMRVVSRLRKYKKREQTLHIGTRQNSI